MEKSSIQPATDHVVILATAPSAEVAERIVRTLIDDQLIACGTILPGARSVFVWDDDVQMADEVQILLKTRASLADQAGARLAAIHPYSTPEVLVLPVSHGYAPYLAWITNATSP